ncbi:hypothetical protein [Ureaplasma diversum]|uniref:site-specific DNA-methyltransferase (adenine-specific) n=1 Tax=Ureaplasma diversum NCTC 246 TaxID=1188241 RepID=A0A084F1F2_9BACT|nr:hypothetical protein [Ureaplasma diversum]KEZ24044.1 Hypothetical protein, putative S-adenosyl-L-methionine-dependent methyltransferase [Ureaplasma diversum NCTC 246]
MKFDEDGTINEDILNFLNEDTFKGSNNEEELRIEFQNQLNHIARALNLTKNHLTFRYESKLNGGRCDFLYGNTIIEYKKYNKLANPNELDKSVNQLKEYIQDNKFKDLQMFGFVFDGCTLEHYVKTQDNEVKKIFGGKITIENAQKLISIIFKNGLRQISPINIQRDFSILSNGGTIVKDNVITKLVRNIYDLLKKRNNQKTELLYLEWEKLFKLSETDTGKSLDIEKRIKIFTEIIGSDVKRDEEYQVLFSLHTALNIIIKLFLVKSTSTLKDLFINVEYLEKYYKTNDILQVKSLLRKVESGKYFEQLNVINLVDGEFFSWYLSENWNENLFKNLKEILMMVDTYNFNEIEIKNNMLGDLFKSLYENFIPKAVRHSFGEYHTPSYLVKFVLDTLQLKGDDYLNKTFVDPCCGSGTFILEIYNNKMKALKSKIDFQEFLNGVVGVDINPISTLITKANIFINSINKVQFDVNKKYEIPIYNCDSLYVPKQININNVDCYHYSLYTTSLQSKFKENIQLILPVELVNKDDFFNILEKLEEYIIDLDINGVMNELSKHIKNINLIEKELKTNFLELIELEKSNLNSIWLKIFSNYFKLASYNNFDYIIGNPAWVRWGDLPQTYRDNLKNNIEIKNIFSSDKNHGGIDLNFCALLTNKCCERWFNKSSKLAYLMPKSIIYNKSFQGFRKLIIRDNEKLQFNEIYDFSKCGEIFEGTGNLEFSLFIISNKSKEKYIPFTILNKVNNTFEIHKKNKLLQLDKYIDENNFLEIEDDDNINQIEKVIGKCAYTFRKGVEAKAPMRFVFCEDIDDKLAYFFPVIKQKKLYKVDETRKIKLEKKYLHPLITSPMLKEEWDNLYVLFLYEFGNKQPLDLDVIKNEVPNIYKWIDFNKNELKKGSDYNNRIQIKPYWGLLRIGEYTFKDIFVCIRDNTSLNPKIITKIKTHWNELKMPIFDGHISYISYSKNINDNLSYDEAKYILNILTNKLVLKIILNSQSSRSISSNIPIKIDFYKQ